MTWFHGSSALFSCVSSFSPLTQLNGNAQIRGQGLAVIGECCPLLKELRLSQCKGLQTWSLARIWTSCHHLEILDLSYLNQLEDEGVRQMSKG